MSAFAKKTLAARFFFFVCFVLRWYIWSEVMSTDWVAMHDAPIHAVWDWLETPILGLKLSGTGFRHVRFRYVLCGIELRNMTLQLCEIYLRQTTLHAMWDWLETHDAPLETRGALHYAGFTWDTCRSTLCEIYLRHVTLRTMWDWLETQDTPRYVTLTWDIWLSAVYDIDLWHKTLRTL